MKKLLKALLILLIIVVALLVGAFFYLKRPTGLGVSYTTADLEAANQKIAVTYEALPIDDSLGKTLIVSGAHPVDQTFTSQEITALADNRRTVYPYFPFQNVQIRVNADGTVEGSATVNYTNAVSYLKALGVAPEDISEAAQKFNIPNADLPVYLKVKGNIVNNESNITVQTAKIANIPIPQNFVDQYAPYLNDLIESLIDQRQPSYNIETLEVQSGKIHFKGTAPDVEKAVKNL